jgi:hypothetical protein
MQSNPKQNINMWNLDLLFISMINMNMFFEFMSMMLKIYMLYNPKNTIWK